MSLVSSDSSKVNTDVLPATAVDGRADAVAALEESLGTLFRRVRSSWKEAAAAIAPGLQPIGYKILSALVHSGPTPSGALGEALAVDKSVMSRQVRTLEELGLVASHPDPSDGRARILEPTDLAVERLRSVRSTSRAALEQRLDEWSTDEITRFAALLEHLAAPTA